MRGKSVKTKLGVKCCVAVILALASVERAPHTDSCVDWSFNIESLLSQAYPASCQYQPYPEASAAMSATVGVCDSAASSPNPTPRTRSKPRRWTAVEDKFLTQLVAKFGDKRGPQGHWKEIGSRFNGRTAKVRSSL